MTVTSRYYVQALIDERTHQSIEHNPGVQLQTIVLTQLNDAETMSQKAHQLCLYSSTQQKAQKM